MGAVVQTVRSVLTSARNRYPVAAFLALLACAPSCGSSTGAGGEPDPAMPELAGKPQFSPKAFARKWNLTRSDMDAKRLPDRIVVFLHFEPDTDDETLDRKLMTTLAGTVEHFSFEGLGVAFVDIGAQTVRQGKKVYRVWLMPVSELARFEAGALSFEALVEKFDYRASR